MFVKKKADAQETNGASVEVFLARASGFLCCLCLLAWGRTISLMQKQMLPSTHHILLNMCMTIYYIFEGERILEYSSQLH